jgi:CDP-diacylglycerol--glycerol-3-phosphate 3-phosphatidyltransferase
MPQRRMNLPNALTLTRIFLVPLLVVVLLTKFEGRQILGLPKEVIGAVIFALASITDWLDGYFARRRKQVTTFGQLIDPLADKLLISAAFIALVQMDLAPAWMVLIIIGREFAVSGLRSIAFARGLSVPPSSLGKLKMVAQVIAILGLLLASEQLPGFLILGQVGLWIAMLSALVSGFDYYLRYGRVLDPRAAQVGASSEGMDSGEVRTRESWQAPSTKLRADGTSFRQPHTGR